MKDKNILIVIENGIIALDIKKQLNGNGYNTVIIHPASKEKIKEALREKFQLMIIEKRSDHEGIAEAVQLATAYNLPTIYLSTDIERITAVKGGFRILMMPFGEDELKEVVKIALDE